MTIVCAGWIKFHSELTKFKGSVTLLEETRAAIKAHPELKKDIEVVRVHKVGHDYILRDFYIKTKSLRDEISLGNEAAKATYKRALKALQGTTDKTLQEVLKKFRPNNPNKPSSNLHWIQSEKKILIIDMM